MAAAKPTAKKAPGRGPRAVAPRPLLQWTAAGLGACLTLGAGGVILGEALQPKRPVDLSVRIEAERRAGSDRIFEVKVTNSGSETAASVEIVGEASGKRSSVSLDYVPGDGEAYAALVFPAESDTPILSVAGWSKP